MALDKATVARIATLARIRVGEDELEPLAVELSGILDWVEQLMAVDTENVSPMTSVAHDRSSGSVRWAVAISRCG